MCTFLHCLSYWAYQIRIFGYTEFSINTELLPPLRLVIFKFLSFTLTQVGQKVLALVIFRYFQYFFFMMDEWGSSWFFLSFCFLKWFSNILYRTSIADGFWLFRVLSLLEKSWAVQWFRRPWQDLGLFSVWCITLVGNPIRSPVLAPSSSTGSCNYKWYR